MNRGSHAGFCTFDERNAGGRFQTQAELKHFKHVLTATRSTVDNGEKVDEIQGESPTKRRSESLSTFARRMKTEREAHEHRIANMNRRITEYHNKEDSRLNASTATTNFPAMHPSTQKISPGIFIRIRSLMPPKTLTMSKPSSLQREPSTWRSGGDDALHYTDKKDRDLYCDALLQYIRQQRNEAARHDSSGASSTDSRGDADEDLDAVPPPPARSLPLGWEEKVDAKGRVFYIDHINRLTTWTDPRQSAAATPRSSGPSRGSSPRSNNSFSAGSNLSQLGAHLLLE
ncbi:hypothetical protein PybrP1_003319 [[Pythium] brassicae (nom. inval.)]|nr:hypothetical protein PybrP1_003319 [[Pythium] brassicae (nom. inval.)]